MDSVNPSKAGFALVTACILFTIIVYTMEKIGVPRSYGIGLSAFFALGLWAVAAFSGGTTRARRFLLADGSVNPAIAATALGCAVTLPVLFSDGGLLAAANPGLLVCLAGAVSSGLALSALLVSRRFNAAGQSDLGEYLFRRYQSRLPGRLMAPAMALALVLLMLPAIAAATRLASWYFASSPLATSVAIAALVALSAILGGLYSATRLGAVAFVVLLISVNLALLLLVLDTGGFPVGQLSVGSNAVEPMWDLEDQLRSLGIARLAGVLGGAAGFQALGADVHIAAGITLILGLIAFPPALHLYASCAEPQRAGRVAARGMAASAFFTLSFFAFLMFAGFGFYQTMLGLPVSEARVEAPVLYSWSHHQPPLITVCGKAVVTPDGLMEACNGGGSHIVDTGDLSIAGGLFAVAAPDLNGQPLAITALLATSFLLVLIAIAGFQALAAANTITGAFYATKKKATGSRRVFWNRLLATLLVALATYAGSGAPDGYEPLLLGFSLIAATALPALLVSLYLPAFGKVAVSSAIGAGFAVTLLFFILSTVGIDLIAGNGDEIAVSLFGLTGPLPGSLGGLYGLTAAIAVLATTWLAANLGPLSKIGPKIAPKIARGIAPEIAPEIAEGRREA
ncbi:MAG: hypothetical protein KDJ80_13545 [Nitratireductor sp.]|nr:hypothetical protein [Nitratireductor sp.]